MKISLTKITCFAFVAAALIATPIPSRAGDDTNAPAAAVPKKHAGLPMHGKVAAVDATAMTFTINTNTIAITSATKIMKAGQPAVFADITVGENVACFYKKTDAGQLTAVSVRIGEKKKKDAAPAADK
jgi:hypothetical protein